MLRLAPKSERMYYRNQNDCSDMRIKAKMLQKGDMLRDGRTITAIAVVEGMIQAMLDDGRRLDLPPAYLITVDRDTARKPAKPSLRLVKS